MLWAHSRRLPNSPVLSGGPLMVQGTGTLLHGVGLRHRAHIKQRGWRAAVATPSHWVHRL